MERGGLYIHIPFCSSRCGYCHFATSVSNEQEPYVEALLREIEEVSRSSAIRGLTFDTLYFGGGTPSLLRPDLLGRVVDALHSKFMIEGHSEFTIEANPETAGGAARHAPFYASIGVNRISIGVQSAVAAELTALDRSHDAGEVRETVAGIRGHVPNINLDFIIGIPGQTSVDRSLEMISDLSPDHVSLYILEIFPGTRLSHLPPPDDEIVERLYFQACDFLRACGFAHYEICNFARPGRECLHNRKYWNGSPYVGLGLSACSLYAGSRFQNTSSLAAYIHDPAKSRAEERLDDDTRARESIFLALRTAEGLDAASFFRRHGFDPSARFRREWDDLIGLGLILKQGDHYRIPERRMLVGNEVFGRFV